MNDTVWSAIKIDDDDDVVMMIMMMRTFDAQYEVQNMRHLEYKKKLIS